MLTFSWLDPLRLGLIVGDGVLFIIAFGLICLCIKRSCRNQHGSSQSVNEFANSKKAQKNNSPENERYTPSKDNIGNKSGREGNSYATSSNAADTIGMVELTTERKKRKTKNKAKTENDTIGKVEPTTEKKKTKTKNKAKVENAKPRQEENVKSKSEAKGKPIKSSEERTDVVYAAVNKSVKTKNRRPTKAPPAGEEANYKEPKNLENNLPSSSLEENKRVSDQSTDDSTKSKSEKTTEKTDVVYAAVNKSVKIKKRRPTKAPPAGEEANYQECKNLKNNLPSSSLEENRRVSDQCLDDSKNSKSEKTTGNAIYSVANDITGISSANELYSFAHSSDEAATQANQKNANEQKCNPKSQADVKTKDSSEEKSEVMYAVVNRSMKVKNRRLSKRSSARVHADRESSICDLPPPPPLPEM